MSIHYAENPDQTVRIAYLERELRIAELKNKASLANNLCPDHRDKQAGKQCLACIIEKAERELAELKGKS